MAPTQPLDPELGKEVFISLVGDLPPLGAADLRTYFLEVHRCCARALVSTETHVDATAFVLSDRIDLDPVYEARAAEFAAVPRLDDVDKAPTMGPILLTTLNLRLAYQRLSGDGSVAGLVKELRAIGLGERPTAIFVPRERTLTFYRGGVDNQPTLMADSKLLGGLNPNDLLGLVEHFHERWTRYPDGLATCWDNAGQRIVHRHAEHTVRNALYVFLSIGVYRSEYVVRELQLTNGRVDIFIFGAATGNKHHHRAVELKVLRSRSIGWKGKTERTYSEPGNKRYVEQGLRQAARYKTSASAAETYLFCFDARLANNPIDVEAEATALSVTYRRYFMESTVSDTA